MKRLAMVSALMLLSGCGGLSSLLQEQEPTLADLPPAQMPTEGDALPDVPLETVAANYRNVLAVTQDPNTRLTVQHRLADIAMMQGEAELASGEMGKASFSDAIEAYEALLRENPDNPRNDELMYQLSKAYDFDGNSQRSLVILEQLAASYPESAHVLETEFRKAESYFSAGDYAAAERNYTRVVEFGDTSAHYTNALYMQGWSRFKQGHYTLSIEPFLATLDHLIPASNQLQDLPRAEAELAQDCLRALAVVFSYSGGAPGILVASEQHGERPYQHLLYQQLGDLYLSQERYRDSAETYKAYTQTYPASLVAHEMQLRVIQSYAAGAFADLIVAEKERYVALFGVHEPYWEQIDDSARTTIAPVLQQYIEELARYNHALAQTAQQKATSKRDEPPVDASPFFERAGHYYRLYIESFPAHEQVPDMAFLLAESQFEIGNYAIAVTDYEWMAYGFPQHARASDAAYNAILAWQELESQNGVRAAASGRVDSELRFASVFNEDSRAPSVLGHAADALLEQQAFEAAIVAADDLLAWQPAADESLRLNAMLIRAHGLFELQYYTDAEQAYQQSLASMSVDDVRRTGTTDNLAAAVYRQAEASQSSEDFAEAASQFARVMQVAPGSDISINAQYDAARNYLLAGNLLEANRLLIDFRSRYPDHALSASVAPTLVANYEQLEQWQAAAGELEGIAATEQETGARHQAAYLAAQYYDRAENYPLALARYSDFAKDSTAPLSERMEAMLRLTELYSAQRDVEQEKAWLGRILTEHNRQSQPSDRSVYLAAKASSALAEYDFAYFSALPLDFPLKQSLQAKKKAMQQTLNAYQTAAAYGVEQYVTLSAYRIAQVYQQLSENLMHSPRPSNIDALALEQYEMMLEEQAFPFEEKAIALHETNARRSWEGIYDEWVKASFVALSELLPARYGKTETGEGDSVAPQRSWLSQALASDEKQLAAFNRYGIYLREEGRFNEAEQAYLSALDISSEFPDTHRNIAVLYDLYLGEQEQALQHYHRYQQLTQAQDQDVQRWIVDLERQLTRVVKGG